MIERFDKCPNCFKPHNGQSVCAHCGFDITGYKIPQNALPPFTVLEGKYMLGRTLGMGGFGITYLGWDMNLETLIAIKEYYPGSFVFRDTTKAETTQITVTGSNQEMYDKGLRRYVEEAKNLSKFYNLPGIVSVKDFFYANGTAYMVMEHVDGITLKAHLEKMGGRMDENTVITLMKPIIESLQLVHEKGLVHRDISPDNIMVNREGKIKLIDFGSVRGQSLESDMTYTVILKHGYAPQEQYYAKGKQGPWTDVYSLCATMYKMLTGQIPPNSIERMSGDTYLSPSACGIKISTNTEKVLNKGLAPKIEDRYQNLGELKDALYNAPKSEDASEQATMLLNPNMQTQSGYANPVSQQPVNTAMVQNNLHNNIQQANYGGVQSQMSGMQTGYQGNAQSGNTVLMNQPAANTGGAGQVPMWNQAPPNNMRLQQPVQQMRNQAYKEPKRTSFAPLIIIAVIIVLGVIGAVVGINSSKKDKKTTEDVVESTRESKDDEEEIIDDTEADTEDEVDTEEVAIDEDSDDAEYNAWPETLSDDWTDYQAELGDTVYQFPMTYDDFTSQGWEVNYDTDVLASGEIREFTAMDGNTDFGIIVGNFYDGERTADDCHVIGIRLNSYWNLSYEDIYYISLPGGAYFDLVDSTYSVTMDDIELFYGTPDVDDDFDKKKTYYDDAGFMEFTYEDDGSCSAMLYCSLETPEGATMSGNVDYYEQLAQISAYQAPADTQDRFDAIMKIGGVNYKLPVPATELIANGWYCVDDISTFKPLEQKYVEMSNGSESIWVYINNYSIYSVGIENLYVDYLYASSYESGTDVVYPGGITYGTAMSDVESLFADIDDMYKSVDDMGDYYQVKIYYPVYDGSVRATYYFEPDASGNYYLTDGFFWRDVTSAVTWTEHKDYIQGYMIQ